MMPIDNFFRSAARWPDRIAVEINDGVDQRKITYGDLAQSVNALANALQTIDPTPQSCVGICANNSFEHLLGWLATYAAGKIWVPLNPRNGSDELNRIIDLTAPSIVIFDADCGEKFGAVTGHLLAGKNGETGSPRQQSYGGVTGCLMLARYQGVIWLIATICKRSNSPAGHLACQKA
jgi:acyl-CoA synthetase (AMP-forming)/AMP-acid ligase II